MAGWLLTALGKAHSWKINVYLSDTHKSSVNASKRTGSVPIMKASRLMLLEEYPVCIV